MDNWGQGTFTLFVPRLYRRAVTGADARVSRLRHEVIEGVQVQIRQQRAEPRPWWHPGTRRPLVHPVQDILVQEPLEQGEQCPITDLFCDTRSQRGFRER